MEKALEIPLSWREKKDKGVSEKNIVSLTRIETQIVTLGGKATWKRCSGYFRLSCWHEVKNVAKRITQNEMVL